MTAQQDAAADPAASVFVSASAGTGKTHVLTNRVLRLLLSGAPPERILCLTYTKAAAAEMANRIQDRLAAWAVEPDERLFATLHQLTGDPPEIEVMIRARRLFALVLDAPGGLRIQTIHAFCQSLLGRFPVEVGLPPGFIALDDRAAARLLAEATGEVLVSPAPALRAAVGQLSAVASDQVFDQLVRDFVAGRMRLPEDLGPAAMARHLDDLALLLGCSPGDGRGRAELVAGFAAERMAAPDRLRRAAGVLAGGTKTDQAAAQALSACCSAFDYQTYAGVFLTEKGQIRQRLITSKLAGQHPDVSDWMAEEAAALAALETAALRAETHQVSRALLVLGTAILDRYHRAKALRRAIDYDDMVLKARDLLTGGTAAAWVLYRLDGGLDHLLIDEAQDTSPAQWQLVRALTSEFFALEGQGGRHRTIFAVGDLKQSIYSFQGAAPEVFGRERRRVGEAAVSAVKLFRQVELGLSFRSAPMVLSLVDAVFARGSARDGVVEGERLEHKAFRAGAAGRVELWPVEGAETVEEGEAWDPGETASRGRSAQTVLAERIARRIADLLAAGEMLPARGRRLAPGDIMVLMRRRTSFVDALTRACKALGVPVAGSDRMKLAEQLGVRDLIAMGRFALLPDDDLTLATVLKGPFIGLSEEALFDLAHPRGEKQSLWHHLGQVLDRPDFAAAHRALSQVLARADYVTPFTFFSRLLDEGGGRRRLIGRLGQEAIEPVEEFLALALRHEAEAPPSLEGFLHAVETGETELKRDLDRGRDELRILTVHASKGLEAPVVILPDTTTLPSRTENLLWSAGGLPVWPAAGAGVVPEVAEIREAMREGALREYRRLLYVALTRAEDRLIVCGSAGGRRKDQPYEDGSWYDLVAAAFPEDAVEEEIAPGFTIRVKADPPGAVAAERGRHAAPAAQALPLPDWARRPAPVELCPSDPLSPSRQADADLGVASPIALGGAARFLRGRLVHRMLELLPDLDPDRRAGAAVRFLARRAEDLTAAEQADLAAETLAVLEDPDFAAVFGPGSRPEVPIAAVIGQESVVGQIDRLAVLSDRVLIVDFKTDRPSPRDWQAVAPGYLRQLALYRAVIGRLYPHLPVEAALLWTETPHLMPVPGFALDASLAGLTGVKATIDGQDPAS